ncbi:PLP-dependent aminotransferase family protein [Metabacillus sp. YM-086]|uniref:aminotransferase-like domain-containing protein n=1 Tax=Metabacillus sp. YM-086 TaxID=3341729 RepID=UPI003A842955
MNVTSFFSENIKAALKNDPPGEWMPNLPENCIRLSSGYPTPDLMPVDEMKDAVASLLDEEKDLPLHYLGSPKMDKLREQIQQRLLERGIDVSANELLVTSGACQAIDLIARILIDEETLVMTESPTYMEALEIFKNYTQHFLTIPLDQDGIQTDVLEDMLADRVREKLTLPRFLYTIPTFQNPTGTTLSQERREHLLRLASTYNFLILEDDAYGELSFHSSPKTLKAMDKENRVLHVGSLSKVVSPGMRVGWVACDAEFINALFWFKKDLEHPFSQAAMASFLEKVDYQKRLSVLRETYKVKCDVLLSSLQQHLPESVSWYVPEGGYFVWVKIPGVDTGKLLEKALDEGVSYIPGKFFFLEQHEGSEFLRLSFSYEDESEIKAGIKKLGKVVKSVL